MIVRILESTANIPKGYQFETDRLEVGFVIEQTVKGVDYKIPIEKIEVLSENVYKVSNSNLIVIVEVFNG